MSIPVCSRCPQTTHSRGAAASSSEQISKRTYNWCCRMPGALTADAPTYLARPLIIATRNRS
jgi:hypothetical protein